MVLSGRVFNVTPYMDYHPGGKAAGARRGAPSLRALPARLRPSCLAGSQARERSVGTFRMGSARALFGQLGHGGPYRTTAVAQT